MDDRDPDTIDELVQNILNSLASQTAIEEVLERLREDDMYAVVARELANENWDEVARLRALTEAGGDTEKAKSLYASIRVRRLKDLSIKRALDEYITSEEERKNEERIRTNGISFLGYNIIKLGPGRYEISSSGIPIMKDGQTFKSIDEAKKYLTAIEQ